MQDGSRNQVLFVDDEERILDGLRRQLRNMRDDWDMRFALSGQQALDMLEERPADIVLSDMRMPGMDGATLLRQVRERWPATVRFILSGQTDQEELLESVGAVHQFLQKPCDKEVIEHAVLRTCDLARTVESDRLRSIANEAESLPVISQTYKKLTDTVCKESGMEEIAKIVEEDIGLSAKLMQMVNSAFFGLPRRVTDVGEAIKFIGTQRLRELAATAQIFDALASDSRSEALIKRLWKVSIDTGAIAASAAKEQQAGTAVREASRLAGTLSLIGRALYIRDSPELFERLLKRSTEEGEPLSEYETESFGAPQEKLGAYVLGIWAFDDPIVDAVARQADPPEESGEPSPGMFLGLARRKPIGDSLADPFTDSATARRREAA